MKELVIHVLNLKNTINNHLEYKTTTISKFQSISPENRRKAREKMNNPDILAGNCKLKELYKKIGVIMYPEKMTNWYP